jgi:DNA-binding response OmpR family regulator
MSYKVLVADGSPSALKAAEFALTAPEFEIFAFSDGMEAMKRMLDIRPDALLVSVSLPSRDGYEVAGYVRSQEGGRQVAVFFLRGAFETLNLGKMAQVGCDGIIQKPFDAGALAGLVRDAIDRKKEIPSLPEEPVWEQDGEAEQPPEAVLPTAPLVPEWTDDLEKKIKEAVRQEIRNNQEELEKIAREVISAEFRKMLVEELKNIDTKKI